MRSTNPSSSRRWSVCASIFSLTPVAFRRSSLKRNVPSRSAIRHSTPQRLVTSLNTSRDGQSTVNSSPRLTFADKDVAFVFPGLTGRGSTQVAFRRTYSAAATRLKRD